MTDKDEKSETIHNIRTYDTFGNPSFITIGDPYVDPKPFSARSAHLPPKQPPFVPTSPPKRGHTNDAFIQKNYTPLNSKDEPYVEQETLRRKERAQSAKRNISNKPFVPTSPPKRSSTPGDQYGQIGKPPEYTSPLPKESKTKEDPSKQHLPNVKVGRFRSGGAGQVIDTFGPSYEYICENDKPPKKDPVGTIKPKKLERPWSGMSRGNKLFHNDVYSEDDKTRSMIRPQTARSRTGATTSRPGTAKSRSAASEGGRPQSASKAWVSMSHSRGTFDPFPKYMSDNEKDNTTRTKRKKEKPKVKPKLKPFIPSGTSQFTRPTRSIVGGHH
ncbi:putative protein of unknown function (DUF4586) [Blattamonas nauphoetae]|uniref:Cilia-and flagella-associated protein 96 n=1 Tax=Blattamonas nauphoetae TaxID=2049346 RepID=A0ABQ9YLE9_9EUKA|nr:putative protein of unknown function (DUF4586) [Blattamonas nauphoetae]